MGLEGIGRFRGSHTCRRQDFTGDDAEMGWACLLPDGSGLCCCAPDLLDRGLATRYGAACLLCGRFPLWATVGGLAWSRRSSHSGSASAALAARRLTLALLAAVLAAGAFVAVACIRSANRQCHLIHPDLHLEESTSVLV